MNKIKSLALPPRFLCRRIAAGAAPARADEVLQQRPAPRRLLRVLSRERRRSRRPYVPPGVNINVENVQTLYAAYVRRLSPHFDVELAAGLPPVTKTYGVGPATLGSVPYNGVISTARWFAPTVLLEYKFLSENSPVALHRRRRQLHDVLRPQFDRGRQRRDRRTDAHVADASVGPAATVGVAYPYPVVGTSTRPIRFSRVNSNLTADTAGVIRTTRINSGRRRW